MDLALQDLTLAYGTHTVLDRVSLRLQGIHALVLIGPSGGGKSTLLRLLAGLARPTAGGIELDGVPLPFPGPGEEDTEGLRQHRTRTGFVFQGHNLFPHLTALENVTLPLIQVHGRTRAEATEEASALLERFRLGRHARQRPAELSGGQQQRVAIARAAAVKPRWLLFDEPTSALDPEMTAEVLDMIAELRAEGRDLVLATHQMGFARRVADHAAFVGDGGIPAHGPTTTFFGEDAPPRVRSFLERVLAY